MGGGNHSLIVIRGLRGFSVGGPLENGLSHYLLTSPIQYCIALPCIVHACDVNLTLQKIAEVYDSSR
jgi:hypothetical protein